MDWVTILPTHYDPYAFSKLLYKCNAIDPRVEDLRCFTSTAESFIYADLLEQPCKLTLYRNIEDGGLGLSHVQYRARAALIMTFLQTAIIPEFQRSGFHNTLYRVYILGEQIQAPQIPPSFQDCFFPHYKKT